jgi:hypothetical protein
MNKVLLDTSVMCCLLKVQGKDTAGPLDDRWDHDRISALVEKETRQGSTLVLPLASLIETGNHISQAPANRFAAATELAGHLASSINSESPWAAFTDQADLWGADKLANLANEWPALAAGGLSIGDATIKQVAEWYATAGFEVEIVTGDAGLKSYEPLKPPALPRSRR